MKILILSDSHRNVKSMEEIVLKEQPDTIFHLGDYESDAIELGQAYPYIPLVHVPGNCDFSSDIPVKFLTLEGKKILLCHGHTYHVKQSLLSLSYAAREKGADIVLFGHTHYPFLDQKDGFWICNPGAIQNLKYAVLTIVDGKIEIILK